LASFLVCCEQAEAQELSFFEEELEEPPARERLVITQDGRTLKMDFTVLVVSFKLTLVAIWDGTADWQTHLLDSMAHESTIIAVIDNCRQVNAETPMFLLFSWYFLLEVEEE